MVFLLDIELAFREVEEAQVSRIRVSLLVHILYSLSVAVRSNDLLFIIICNTKNCDLGKRQLILEAHIRFSFAHPLEHFPNPLESGKGFHNDVNDSNSLERKGGDEVGRAAVHAGHLARELEESLRRVVLCPSHYDSHHQQAAHCAPYRPLTTYIHYGTLTGNCY